MFFWFKRSILFRISTHTRRNQTGKRQIESNQKRNSAKECHRNQSLLGTLQFFQNTYQKFRASRFATLHFDKKRQKLQRNLHRRRKSSVWKPQKLFMLRTGYVLPKIWQNICFVSWCRYWHKWKARGHWCNFDTNWWKRRFPCHFICIKTTCHSREKLFTIFTGNARRRLGNGILPGTLKRKTLHSFHRSQTTGSFKSYPHKNTQQTSIGNDGFRFWNSIQERHWNASRLSLKNTNWSSFSNQRFQRRLAKFAKKLQTNQWHHHFAQKPQHKTLSQNTTTSRILLYGSRNPMEKTETYFILGYYPQNSLVRANNFKKKNYLRSTRKITGWTQWHWKDKRKNFVYILLAKYGSWHPWTHQKLPQLPIERQK